LGDKEQDQPMQADPPSEAEPELPFGESEWEQRGGWPDVETTRQR
jgi:hypothetical protein